MASNRPSPKWTWRETDVGAPGRLGTCAKEAAGKSRSSERNTCMTGSGSLLGSLRVVAAARRLPERGDEREATERPGAPPELN